jgi:biotin carboxyl carrier protein
MPEASSSDDRTPAQREADHASLARLSDTLLPALVQKLATSGLGELEVREGSWRVRLRRPIAAAPATTAGRRAERPRPGTHPPERDPRSAREPKHEGPDAADDADTRRSVATSPAVGVFRADATPGSRVRAGDRIGTVDLLGIAQDVVAPADGTLVEFMAASGEAVEYGEPVAAVEADPPAAVGDDDANGEG